MSAPRRTNGEVELDEMAPEALLQAGRETSDDAARYQVVGRWMLGSG